MLVIYLKSFLWPWIISWTAAGSSKVLRSPKPSRSHSTTLRRTLRMILPERVFGRRVTNCGTHTRGKSNHWGESFKLKLHRLKPKLVLPEWSLDRRTLQFFQTPSCSAAWTDPPPECLRLFSAPQKRTHLEDGERLVFYVWTLEQMCEKSVLLALSFDAMRIPYDGRFSHCRTLILSQTQQSESWCTFYIWRRLIAQTEIIYSV